MFKLMYIFLSVMLLIDGVLCILHKNKKMDLVIKIFLLSYFIFLVGIRPLSIPDTMNYFEFYKEIDLNLFNLKFSYFEKGFVFFSKVIKKYISSSERIYFSIVAIFNLVLLGKSLKKEYKKVLLPLFLYISYYGIYYNMIILRFGIGFTFFVMAVFYNKNRKTLKSLFFFIISYFFHKSFIFGIFIYLIPKKKLNKNLYLIIIITIFFFYYFRIGDNFITKLIEIYNNFFPFENRYRIYLENISKTSGYSYRFFLNYLILIYIYLEGKIDGYFYNIYIFGLLFLSIFSGILLIERITDIYVGLNIFCISYYIENNKNLLKNILFYSIIIFFNFIFITRILRIF